MIDSALFDVECPLCHAGPLELCTANGRYMESTVHGPRRIRADVPLIEEPKRNPGGRPKGTAVRPDPTKCLKLKHEWVEENIYTSPDGHHRCRPCRNDRQRTGLATKRRQRPEATRRYNTDHCRNGHEYTAENTYRAPNNGSRRCITCRENHRKTHYAKKKETV